MNLAPLVRYSLRVLCCAIGVTAVAAVDRSGIGDPSADAALNGIRQVATVRTNGVANRANRFGSSLLRAGINGSGVRAYADLASADSNLVIALTELERQARDVPNLSLRALFAERAQALYLLASEVQSVLGHHVAALWLSDRARQAAVRAFASPTTEIADLPLTGGLASAVPTGGYAGVHPDVVHLAFHSIQGVTFRANSAEDLGRELIRAVPSGVTVVYQDLRSDQLATWVIRDGQVHFVATPISAATLSADIKQFRADLEAHNGAAVLGAKHLYDALFGPVREHMTGSGLLVYSPASALRGVPVSALHDGEHFLGQQRAIGVTRSLGTVLSRLQATSTIPDAALVTLPAPASRLPFLAGARYEATAVAKAYGARATSLLGVDATTRAFFLMAPKFDVIHIGTHGHADEQPLQSAIDFGSEQIRASEIMNIRLPHAPVVVLAGCRTDDETEGKTTITLSSAFITAGASAVVGSLWNVEDQATARLMIDFHSHLSQGVAAAEALSLAQKSAIARHEDIASWAAFQVQM